MKVARLILCAFTTIFFAILAGCAHPDDQFVKKSQFYSRTDIRRLAYLGLHQLREGNYQQARFYFARGLRENPKNCELNFLNGLAYQLEARGGSIKMLELAQVGYQNAMRACPNDPWPKYYNGVLALQKNNYLLAEKMFAEASAATGNTTKTFLKGYLYTAYRMGDVRGVKAALNQLKNINPNSALVKELELAFQYIRTPVMETVEKKEVYTHKKKKRIVRQIARALPASTPVISQPASALPPLAQTTGAAIPAPTAPQPMGMPAALPPPSSIPAVPTASPQPSIPMSPAAGPGPAQAIPPAPPPMPVSQPMPAPTTPPPMPTSQPMSMQPAPMPSMPMPTGAPGSTPPIQLGQPTMLPSMQTPTGPMPSAPVMPGQLTSDHRQLIVEGIIILSRVTENSQTGVNLLKGLTLQYGNGTTAGLAYTNSVSNANAWPDVFRKIQGSGSEFTLPTLPFTSSLVQTISIPAVTYDMNIFNDSNEKSEIIARPSVLIENNHSANYFSGRQLILGIQGTQTGTVTTFPLGVSLAVTPTFQKNGSIDLTIDMGREFLISASNSTTFTQVAQTLKEDTATAVNLRYGQTIILSTLFDAKLDTTKNETPFLSKIPIIKYFFSNKTKQVAKTNLIMLLTPKKYMSFPSDDFTPPAIQELMRFYENLADKGAHLNGVINELQHIKLMDTLSPLNIAFSDLEMNKAIYQETRSSIF